MTMLCPCGRPSRLPLCGACAADLDRLLATVPDLLDDLEVTLTRQDRIVSGGGRRGSGERPLPINLAAVEARDLLTATIEAWSAAVVDLGAPTAARGAHGLRAHLQDLRLLPDAHDALEEVTHAVAYARRAIDLRRETSWVGVCGALIEYPDGSSGRCEANLFASIVEDEVVACPTCRTPYRVADRREVLLDVARDRLLPQADLVRFARAFGFKLTDRVVDGLVRRAHLAPLGTHPDGRSTYRVGDLLDHLTRRRTT